MSWELRWTYVCVVDGSWVRCQVWESGREGCAITHPGVVGVLTAVNVVAAPVYPQPTTHDHYQPNPTQPNPPPPPTPTRSRPQSNHPTTFTDPQLSRYRDGDPAHPRWIASGSPLQPSHPYHDHPPPTISLVAGPPNHHLHDHHHHRTPHHHHRTPHHHRLIHDHSQPTQRYSAQWYKDLVFKFKRSVKI